MREGRVLLEAGKGVAVDEVAALRAVDPRPPAYWELESELTALTVAVAAEAAASGLDGRRVAIEGFDGGGPALVAALVERGARVVAIATAAGTAVAPDGFDPAVVAEAWAAHGPDLVATLDPDAGPAVGGVRRAGGDPRGGIQARGGGPHRGRRPGGRRGGGRWPGAGHGQGAGRGPSGRAGGRSRTSSARPAPCSPDGPLRLGEIPGSRRPRRSPTRCGRCSITTTGPCWAPATGRRPTCARGARTCPSGDPWPDRGRPGAGPVRRRRPCVARSPVGPYAHPP